MNKLVKIGEVSVDSAELMIIDPMYLVDKNIDEIRNIDRDGLFVRIENGLGVKFLSGWGDGIYPVFAKIKSFKGDKRITEVVIKLIDEEVS